MRGALVHVFTGLALGVALVGLLHAPTELIAQQEARTPAVQPKAATAGLWAEEQTVRVSPKVERDLELQRARRMRPETTRPARPRTTPTPPILVRATVPVTPAAPPAALRPDQTDAKPKPKPKPKAPPESAPAPAPPPPPEVVTPSPQPVYTPASEEEGKKSKKSKKSKKHKKPKKDKGEKHDKHDKKDKADEKDRDDRGNHGDDDAHDERDKDKHDDDDDDDDDD